MKTIIQIIKGMLLWMTAFSISCFTVGGFEGLIEAGKWLPGGLWFVGNIIMGYLCYACLSYEEAYKLSGSMWIERLLKIGKQINPNAYKD